MDSPPASACPLPARLPTAIGPARRHTFDVKTIITPNDPMLVQAGVMDRKLIVTASHKTLAMKFSDSGPGKRELVRKQGCVAGWP